MPPDEPAAALVVLQPGARDPERVRRWFAEAGFELGPLVGISFSISGPASLLGRAFQDFETRRGGDAELDLSALPDELRSIVRAVVTEAPPDFGPGAP